MAQMSMGPQVRYPALDVLRGIAILGILFANIPTFGFTWYGEQISGLAKSEVGWDAVIDATRTALVSGKFRSILAVLFGIGLYLQFEKRSSKGSGWPGGYVRRMAVLAVLGIIHTFFIWIGDILLVYAVTSLICMWFLYAPPHTIRILMWVGIGLVSLGSILLVIGLGVLEHVMPEVLQDIDKSYQSEIAQEKAIFATGTYWQQVIFRLQSFSSEGFLILSFGIAIAPLFLVGVVLGQSGFLKDSTLHTQTTRRILWWTLGLGIPLNLLGLLYLSSGSPIWLKMLAEMVSGPLVAVGIVVAAIHYRVGQSGKLLTRSLAAVGRVALTCYILQSIIATSIFYSWGGGLFEKLTHAQLLLVAVGIDLVLVFFAVAWSRKQQPGPIEWLWRKLSGDLKKLEPKIAFEL